MHRQSREAEAERNESSRCGVVRGATRRSDPGDIRIGALNTTWTVGNYNGGPSGKREPGHGAEGNTTSLRPWTTCIRN